MPLNDDNEWYFSPEEQAYITRLLIQGTELRRLYIKNVRFHVTVDEYVRSLPHQINLLKGLALDWEASERAKTVAEIDRERYPL